MGLSRCVILALTAATCFAIPKNSTKAELQRLARLPRVEFPMPLQFQRLSGFVVAPDPATAAVESARHLKDLEDRPADAPALLEAARLHDRNGDLINSLRHYSQAVELFRRQVETNPEEISALTGLAEALSALGRFSEAESFLDRAARTNPADLQAALSRARLYRERAWFSVFPEGSRFDSASLLEQLTMLVWNPPQPGQIEEAERFLDRAREIFDHLDGKLTHSAGLVERATLHSIREALGTAFTQIQTSEFQSRALRQSLYNQAALRDLAAAAELPDAEPHAIASIAMARFYSGEQTASQAGRDPAIRAAIVRLQELATDGSENAAEAAELLGVLQMNVLHDFRGAQRTLRRAISIAPERHRAWELYILASANVSSSEFVEAAEARVAALPEARSSVLLAKAFDREGDAVRAQITALTGITTYPNDFLMHLTFAALLLKDQNVNSYLWRARESINKAETQMGRRPGRQARLDFILTKGIYLALTDQPEQARRLLEQSGSPPELQELLRLLD